MAYIDDRWTIKNPETGRRTKTDRYGKGLRWRVEWRDHTDTKRRKSFENKALAEDFLTDIRAEQKAGVYRGPQTSETIAELVDMYIEQKSLKPSTVGMLREKTRNLFTPAFGKRAASSLTRRDIQEFVNRSKLDYSPTTIRNSYRVLAGVLKWARNEGIIHTTPCVGIELPKQERTLIRPLTQEQVLAISETMPEPFQSMALFAAATGLRIGELRAVTWDRIDLDKKTITVDRQLDNAAKFCSPKTSSSYRVIRLGDETINRIVQLRDEVGEGGPDRFVFSYGDRPISRTVASQWWRKARNKYPDIGSGFHQLRHFHASQLIAMGLSPVSVASRLGHKNAVETLETYAHLWEGEDDRMARAGDMVFSLAPHSPPEVPKLRAI
jgi:integrase